MLNRLRKLSIFLITSLLLLNITVCVPVLAENAKGIPVMTEETTQNLVPDNTIKDLDIEPLNTEHVKKNVVPDTKKEGKKLIGLFLKTMFLVVLCCSIIYIVLFIVKKFYKSSFVPADEEYENSEMLELITPETKNDALRSFLNRSK